jgi:hypothetical protein
MPPSHFAMHRMWPAEMAADSRVVCSHDHGWFTEGFDTADLKDAKALLDELNK